VTSITAIAEQLSWLFARQMLEKRLSHAIGDKG
jgi:hypothetical protein